MSDIAKISKLVKSQFPQFYHEEGERFMAFVQAYYEYMEQTGKMSDAIRNLENYHDISTTTDDFIKYYINSFLPSVPLDVIADKKLLVKNIKDFNLARGTLSSYKLLFRALYNEDLEITYPADQVLIVSQGDWRKERYLVASYDPEIYTFIGQTIVGRVSGAQALVEDVVRKTVRGRDISQILLSNVKGSFQHLESIQLLSTINDDNPMTFVVDAGIASIDIIGAGGQYQRGDVVDLISLDIGDFGKAVVTETQDLLGSLSFSLVDGGSGYTSSTATPSATSINFDGGDGTEPGSFIISDSDITDTFAIAINTNLFTSNTVYGELAPIVTAANGDPIQMSTFANTIIGSTVYGFPEYGEEVTSGINYRNHKDAIITIANTADIEVGDSLYGVTSSANANVVELMNGTPGAAVLKIDGYNNFQTSESVKITTSSGLTVGTVSGFQGNVIGYHVMDMANLTSVIISEGDEVVGLISGSYGIVKKILNTVEDGYTNTENPADVRDLLTVIVTANNSSNLTSQFDVGPLKPFIEHEPLRLVNSSTVIANCETATSNVTYESVYTKLQDALQFAALTFGTISRISLPVGGAGYSVAPTIRVRQNDIAALGIGESFITLQSDDLNWSTGNSSFTTPDTNDRLVQSSTGATADIKTILTPVFQHSNGTYETSVRVWQSLLQREPGGINFANDAIVSINVFDSSYVFGEEDARASVGTGTAKIVSITDRGILGQNANISASVGANGAIVAMRVIDSGFCYKDNEIVIVETPNRNLGVSAQLRLSLNDVANSEGYYATTRSHISSSRGYIQDSRYYQEYSYEISSPLSLDKYRDTILKLAHPAGQVMFGKFKTQSLASVDVVASSRGFTRTRAEGTIDINSGAKLVLGLGTSFLTQFANSDTMVIEYANNQYYSVPINIVSSDTSANLHIAWSNTSISDANVYYITVR
jgi:hypothetical protein